MLIFAEGGKLENSEENPRSKGENQQQTQLTCDAEKLVVIRKVRLRWHAHVSPSQTAANHIYYLMYICAIMNSH
jgi:hypothetical protein